MANLSVFVSNAPEDQETAKQLYEDLKLMGVTPWLESENLLAGQNRELEIRQAIRNSDYFILLISSHSINGAGFFQKEQKIALDVFDKKGIGNIFIIPGRLDGTEPLDERLQNLHWADFSDYQRGLFNVMKTLKQGIPKRGKPAPETRIHKSPSGP